VSPSTHCVNLEFEYLVLTFDVVDFYFEPCNLSHQVDDLLQVVVPFFFKLLDSFNEVISVQRSVQLFPLSEPLSFAST
jgi:hypothetical protein